MLGIFLFVFCSQALQEFPNFVATGVNGYWQAAIPPDPAAAAFAKKSDEAATYLSCLKGVITNTTKFIIGSYGEVTGQDHNGGALLTVKGFKVFVAGVAFAKVLERHIETLIGNYVELEARVKASTSQPLADPEVVNDPVPLSNNAGQSETPPEQPELDALAANNSPPDPTAGNSTVADEQKAKAAADRKAKEADGNLKATQLGLLQLEVVEKITLASMDPSAYQKFLDEWNQPSVSNSVLLNVVAATGMVDAKKVGEFIVKAYPKMDNTQRQRLWTYGPKQTDLVLLWIDQVNNELVESKIKPRAISEFKDRLWKELGTASFDKKAPINAWNAMMGEYYVQQTKSSGKKYSPIKAPSFN